MAIVNQLGIIFKKGKLRYHIQKTVYILDIENTLVQNKDYKLITNIEIN